MQVLVVESHLGASQGLSRELHRRGHDVLRCSDDEHQRAGCKALDADAGCPLDEGTVSVAVDVRRSYHPGPRPLEQGAVCAVRARVPLVVAGSAVDSPLESWATTVVTGDAPAVADAVEAVDGGLAPQHQRVVDEALEALLPGEGASAVVQRGEDRIRVEMSLPRHLDDAQAEAVAVRVVAALRRFDRQTSVIDVATGPDASAT